MKYVVSFSGGRSSAYCIAKSIEKYGKENVNFVYMDTGLEHPLTYKFIRQVVEYFDINLTCLQADFSKPLGSRTTYKIVDAKDLKTDFSIFKAMLAKYGVPYVGGMFCTSRLKTRPFKAYCDKVYGKGKYKTIIGIRADEPSRLIGDNNYKNAKKLIGCSADTAMEMFYDYLTFGSISAHFVNQESFEYELRVNIEKKLQSDIDDGKVYLAEVSEWCDKQDVNNYWSKMPFDLEIPEWLGNCMFCPKKSNLKLAAAAHDEELFYNTYVEMIKSSHVRIDENTGHWSKMYRGKQSLPSLIASFDGATGYEIKNRIRGAKMEESGSCSESCEML